MSTGSKFSYTSSKAQKFTMASVRLIIDRLLVEDANGLWSKIDHLLSEPGETGRVSWDQCLAVQELLAADSDSGRQLTLMVEKGNLSLPMVGEQLIKQLRNANLVIERGRIVAGIESDEMKRA